MQFFVQVVVQVGYVISTLSLVLFIIGICMRTNLLFDMFYMLRLNFAAAYLVAVVSMWVADLSPIAVLADRHSNIVISALQQYFFMVRMIIQL